MQKVQIQFLAQSPQQEVVLVERKNQVIMQMLEQEDQVEDKDQLFLVVQIHKLQ